MSLNNRRTKELEKKQIETEVERRVKEAIDTRMTLEMEKQKDTIEAEIQRRVAEGRKQMDKMLAEELEKQKQIDYKRQLEKEVCSIVNFFSNYNKNCDINNNNNNKETMIIIEITCK